jgi:hypothetical protein
MNYQEQPRLTIFKNEHAGKPIKKQDGSFVSDSNGNPIKQSELNGKINLPEDLAAGDYEVAIYKKEYTDKKTGELKTMYSGRIKKAYVKQDRPIDAHSRAKADAFQPQKDLDDTIPDYF